MLIEYATLDEAKAAIDGANNTKLLDQTITVDYAFVRPPVERGQGGGRGGRGGRSGGRDDRRGGGRNRSRSPGEDRRRDREDDDDAE